MIISVLKYEIVDQSFFEKTKQGLISKLHVRIKDAICKQSIYYPRCLCQHSYWLASSFFFKLLNSPLSLCFYFRLGAVLVTCEVSKPQPNTFSNAEVIRVKRDAATQEKTKGNTPITI